MRTATAVLMFLMFGSLAQAQDGKVVIYRQFFDVGIHAKVWCDGKQVGTLNRNQYVEVTLSAGRHVCTALKADQAGVAFTVEGGTQYFVLEQVGNGFGLGRSLLLSVPVETWNTVAPKLHRQN